MILYAVRRTSSAAFALKSLWSPQSPQTGQNSVEVDAADGEQRPGWKRRVAVLAQHVAVDVLRVIRERRATYSRSRRNPASCRTR